jgi:translation initiation factor IF-1
VPGSDAILVEGRVVEVRSARLFRVELANGHRVLAHPVRRDAEKAARLVVGELVKLEMSPFDMSKGRLRIE